MKIDWLKIVIIIRKFARTGMLHEHTTPHLTLTTQRHHKASSQGDLDNCEKGTNRNQSRVDGKSGKRPDGVTLTSWSRGKPLAWDVTVTDTSYIQVTLTSTSATADKSAINKKTKYSNLTATHLFIPIAIETSGVWCSKLAQFIE